MHIFRHFVMCVSVRESVRAVKCLRIFTIIEIAGKLVESAYLPLLRFHFTFLMASCVHLKLLDVETSLLQHRALMTNCEI